MTYRLPTLNGLRAFEAAARHLSFTIAANELGVTAGAVSQQVKKLEASLGVALFRRLPHGLLLTAEGEAYYPRISHIFQELTQATEDIAPALNAKKFTLGLCPKAALLLPKNWPRHSTALSHFVRDICITNDLALVLDNKLDCMVRTSSDPIGRLSAVTIGGSNGSGRETGLYYVCRDGLINCRQSQAIIDDLKTCLA